MTPQRIKELRTELEAERISYDEVAEIEDAFAEIPDSELPEPRENAMAGDMLDELEVRAGTNQVQHTMKTIVVTLTVCESEVHDLEQAIADALEGDFDCFCHGIEPRDATEDESAAYLEHFGWQTDGVVTDASDHSVTVASEAKITTLNLTGGTFEVR